MNIVKEKALVHLANKASTDLTGKEGYVAVYDSGVALAATANLAGALGVIVEGGATESDVAIAGAFGGTVLCKAGGTIAAGAKVKVDNGGTVTAYASGAGTVIGVALEAAQADELVEVALRTPITFAS